MSSQRPSSLELIWKETRKNIKGWPEFRVIAQLLQQPKLPKLPVQTVVQEFIALTQKAFQDHEADTQASSAKDFFLSLDQPPYSPLTGHVARTWFAFFELVRTKQEPRHKRLVHFVRKLKQVSLVTPESIKDQYSPDHLNQALWTSLPLLDDVVAYELRPYKVLYWSRILPARNLKQLENQVSFWAKLTALSPPRPHPWFDHEVPDDLGKFGTDKFIADAVLNILDPNRARAPEPSGEAMWPGQPSEVLLRAACLWIGHCASRFWEICVSYSNHLAQLGQDHSTLPIPALTVSNWEKWRTALRRVLDATRCTCPSCKGNGHVGEIVAVAGRGKLSDDTVALLKETLEEMDRARSQGPQPLEIDWKANFKSEDELEADAEVVDGKGDHLHWGDYSVYVDEHGERVYYEHEEGEHRYVDEHVS